LQRFIGQYCHQKYWYLQQRLSFVFLYIYRKSAKWLYIAKLSPLILQKRESPQKSLAPHLPIYRRLSAFAVSVGLSVVVLL